ncbi:hypothetical protein PIB30_086365 [Stylosanthes scabra]|uniref:Uncharacterized protein n=1 Tax=Stylosanthes scabra TaxID=79078 RepID=A0ABU6ZRN8_9FABA|nr:hypothetical protein [Stylosanthes scabra]
MSWIYQRFPRWCPDAKDVVVFPLASRVKRQLGGEQPVPEDPVNLDGFLYACRVRYLSPHDAIDDSQLDGLPNEVLLTSNQSRDRLSLPADVPITRRRRREHRPDIRRQARGGRGRGPDRDPKRPLGAMDSEDEEEYKPQEDGAGASGHGEDIPVAGDDIPIDDDFFTRPEHEFAASFGTAGPSTSVHPPATQGFMDPAMGFISKVSESQFDDIASRYMRLRDAATETTHLALPHPPLPLTTSDMSWISPITPPSVDHRLGGSVPPNAIILHCHNSSLTLYSAFLLML